MDKQDIKRLLERLDSPGASDADRMEIERLLETGAVTLEEIEGLDSLQTQISDLEAPPVPRAMDDRFYEMLNREKRKQERSAWKGFFSFSAVDLVPKLTMASAMLVIGLAAGYFLSPRHDQIETLSEQVSDLQEMMMLSLLEKGSATERLKAVTLTQEMAEASRKVTSALIRTLNEDENVNVRLAALEALKPYAADSGVRAALIQSIARQESPMVQISLAELMVALREKSAVREFERIVGSEKTPPEVKQKIRESIDILI